MDDGPARTVYEDCVPVKFAKAAVAVVAPVPPFAMATVPVTLAADPLDIAFVTKAVVATCVVFVPAVAVGAKGVPVNVGDADNTTLPVPVSSEITPANSVEEVDDITFNLSVVTTNVFDVGIVVLLILVAVAAPKTGVTKVGDVAKTATPVPVSFVKAVAKSADVNEPKDVAFPVDVTAPVKFALVVATTPVSAAPLPTKLVADKAPVLGTKDNLVLVTFCGKLPVLAVTNVG